MTFNPETKKNIAKILELLFSCNISLKPRIKNRVLSELIWSATEDSDEDTSWKYAGQTYWSETALKRLVSNKITRRTNRKHNLFKDLRHEHIITKEEIIKLIKAETVSSDAYFNILDKFAHAAIVDKDEEKKFKGAKCDRKTPEGYIDDVFIRYRLSAIKLCSNVSKSDIEAVDEDSLEELIARKSFNFEIR